jgi:hypothetical protein
MALVGFLCLSGCYQKPRVDVRPSIENDKVVFAIRHSGDNGLLSFKVKNAAGDLLWEITLNYFHGTQIVYGELPSNTAHQKYPADGKTPTTIRSSTVIVEIDVQYDDPVPTAQTFSHVIQIQ